MRQTDPSLRGVDAALSGWRYILSTHNQVFGMVVVVKGNCIIHRVNSVIDALVHIPHLVHERCSHARQEGAREP